jgi:hypothetical protein
MSPSDRAAGGKLDLPGEEGTPESERLTMALLYLLVQFSTRGGCIRTVLAIGQHLEMLAARRDIGPALRTTGLAVARPLAARLRGRAGCCPA